MCKHVIKEIISVTMLRFLLCHINLIWLFKIFNSFDYLPTVVKAKLKSIKMITIIRSGSEIYQGTGPIVD